LVWKPRIQVQHGVISRRPSHKNYSVNGFVISHAMALALILRCLMLDACFQSQAENVDFVVDCVVLVHVCVGINRRISSLVIPPPTLHFYSVNLIFSQLTFQ
jgi:hypothetical protein